MNVDELTSGCRKLAILGQVLLCFSIVDNFARSPAHRFLVRLADPFKQFKHARLHSL